MSKLIKYGIIFLIFSILLAFYLIVPVPETHYSKTDYYTKTFKNISKINYKTHPDSVLEVGYSRQNLMYSEPLKLAGYGFRGEFESVYDSLKINTLFIENSQNKVAIVNLDLLIFPPEIVAKLTQELPKIGLQSNQIFFSATHTHSATGGWSKPPISWLFGGYNQKVINFITAQILVSIQKAQQNKTAVTVGFQKKSASEFVKNRLTKDKQVDDYLRVINFKKANGKSILWTTFSAHPTCLNSKQKIASRDYTGILIDSLEAKSEVEFALFSAGAVGSHAPATPQKSRNFEKIKIIGKGLSQKIDFDEFDFSENKNLNINKLPVFISELSPRISEKWQIRPSFFKKLIQPQNLNITFLRIGNNLICGIPADFSGELMSELEKTALKKDLNLMITSFNGNYIGYILPQNRLEISRDETREMNWLNNYSGEYFSEIIEDVIQNQK